jgi:uncharacterized protein YndB with AHSA1/START domain
MLKKALIGVAVLVVALIAFISTRPSTFHVERSLAIAAPPAVAYGYVNELKRWPDWSPWEKLDPAMKRTFEGPAGGVGASYYWSGNDQVGEGRMTVTDSVPASKVAMKLEFMRPWESTSSVEFALKPEPTGVNVTWAMNGDHNFMSNAMSLFMDMDKMVGTDFEKGLVQLKAASEAEAKRLEEESKKAAAAAAPEAAQGSAPAAK